MHSLQELTLTKGQGPTMDDETFSTESEPWVTVHNNRRRLNVVISGVLLVAASVAALVLGLTLYDQGGQPRGVSSSTGEPPLAAPPPTPAPTSQTLFQFLQQESLSDGSELEDTSTYQYKAYTWLASTSHESLSDSSILQRFTLACIYYATFQVRTLYTDAVYGYEKTIPTWNQTKNWLSSKDECSWFGILCNDNGEVMDIELYGNYLTGTFPPEIIHLKQSLITLDLYDNVIWNKGDEGLYWLEHLTNLEYLFYGDTFFQYDGIPTYIGALTNLVEFDCSRTLNFGILRGNIFSNLTKLSYLSMGDNSFDMVEIPTQIVNLPELQYLYLHHADLQGNLSFLPTMHKIREFWIDKNPGIIGSIPTGIGQVTSLVSFSATECSLTDKLPSELGQVVNLRKFWISRNKLTGTMPTEIGAIKELEIFQLYDNSMVGPMPNQVCNLVAPSSVGGNLTSLIPDCEWNCTCCTSCM